MRTHLTPALSPQSAEREMKGKTLKRVTCHQSPVTARVSYGSVQ